MQMTDSTIEDCFHGHAETENEKPKVAVTSQNGVSTMNSEGADWSLLLRVSSTIFASQEWRQTVISSS